MGIAHSSNSTEPKNTVLLDEIAYPIQVIRDRLISVRKTLKQLVLPKQTLIKAILAELNLVIEELKVFQDKLQPDYEPLSTSVEDVKQARIELELRVEARTLELLATNEHLLNEVVERKRAEVALERSLILLRGTIEATVDGILVSQNAETIVAFNQKFLQMWGISESTIASRSLKQVLPFILEQVKEPETFAIEANDLFSQADAAKYSIFDLKDGRIIEHYSQPQWMGKTIIGRVCSFRDITERNRSQAALQKSEATNQALLNAIPDLMIRMSRSGIYLDFIPAKSLSSIQPYLKMQGRSIYEVMPPEIARQRMHYVEQALLTGETQIYEFQLAWSAEHISFEEARIVVSGEDEVLVIIRDITERKQMEEALRASEERYRRIIETTSEGVLIIDAENQTVFANKTMAQLLGYSLEEMLGMSLLSFVSPEQRSLAIAAMSYVQNSKQDIRESFDLQLCCKDGTILWALVSANAILDRTGKYAGALGMFTDITQRKIAEEKIHYQALHDLLTDLPNRTMFNEKLEAALIQAKNQHLLAVLFLDLDRFKTINDTLGHAVGDRLLQAVAQRLDNCLQAHGIVARWGGDEFTILLPKIINATASAEISQAIINTLKPAFNLEGHQLHISSSIGIALYPTDGEDGETLVRNADAALYRSKQKGRNNYQFYTAAMNSQASELLLLENDLYYALSHQQFEVYYQPQVNTTTKEITGMEALVRWHHPQFGLISPAKFIPLAEETGLIVPLDQWVLQTACIQNKAWQDAGLPSIRMSVNLSARQFQQPALIGIVAETLEETGLAPEYLELEITETIAMEDVELSKMILDKLHEMGVHLSIDDFGTGYSSLSYLKQFPLNTLKIDKSFINDVASTPQNASIIKAIMTLGKGFNLRIIAEGVETQAQKDCLQSLKCEEIQGYFFSPPLPTVQATDFLANSRSLLADVLVVA